MRTFLPGLTSTKKDRIPDFIADMQRLEIREIALFPTCLEQDEREYLYRELGTVTGLKIPHVHLRSDCSEEEIDLLAGKFGTSLFNVHPESSSHPFPLVPERYAKSFFVENVDVVPTARETGRIGGLCPDFSHWENASAFGRTEYDQSMRGLLSVFFPGCCHLSAIRVGDHNDWNGEWDHHNFRALSDFDYLAKYRGFIPGRYCSLELENCLEEQIEAAGYIASLLA